MRLQIPEHDARMESQSFEPRALQTAYNFYGLIYGNVSTEHKNKPSICIIYRLQDLIQKFRTLELQQEKVSVLHSWLRNFPPVHERDAEYRLSPLGITFE